jgi:hypothetical protein
MLADVATLEQDDCSSYECEREWRDSLRAALDCIIEEHRDIGCRFPTRTPGNPLTYPVWPTGGVSWDAAPTEVSDHFQDLMNHEPIYSLLLKWAQEDTKGNCHNTP